MLSVSPRDILSVLSTWTIFTALLQQYEKFVTAHDPLTGSRPVHKAVSAHIVPKHLLVIFHSKASEIKLFLSISSKEHFTVCQPVLMHHVFMLQFCVHCCHEWRYISCL